MYNHNPLSFCFNFDKTEMAAVEGEDRFSETADDLA